MESLAMPKSCVTAFCRCWILSRSTSGWRSQTRSCFFPMAVKHGPLKSPYKELVFLFPPTTKASPSLLGGNKWIACAAVVSMVRQLWSLPGRTCTEDSSMLAAQVPYKPCDWSQRASPCRMMGWERRTSPRIANRTPSSCTKRFEREDSTLEASEGTERCKWAMLFSLSRNRRSSMNCCKDRMSFCALVVWLFFFLSFSRFSLDPRWIDGSSSSSQSCSNN
mmetsp:Transcript_9719/g.24214  ORF Transcript_9719/g.24214 Transcript_9719/m.24214 type:complete len:221 (+) Transcript_9719:1843-2505(+)